MLNVATTHKKRTKGDKKTFGGNGYIYYLIVVLASQVYKYV